jgi:L-alanine-DL-glutamate epimerase-like enolase superfamily enzyme
MKRIVLIGIGACAAVVVGVTGVPAQSVDDAVKTFESMGADAEKLKQFCALNKLLENVGEKDDPATEKQIEEAVEKLGGEFAAAWEASEKVDEKSADGKRFYDALSALADKCS